MKRILTILALALCAGAGIAQAEVTGLDQRYGLAMIRVKGNGLEPVIQKCSDLEKEGVLPLGEHLRDVSECVTIVANESAPSEVSSGEESKRWLAQEMNNSQQGRLLRFPFVSYPKYAERAQARPAVVPVAARMPATTRAVENSEAERNRAGWFKAEEETVRRGALILEGAKKRIALERKMRRLREVDQRLNKKIIGLEKEKKALAGQVSRLNRELGILKERLSREVERVRGLESSRFSNPLTLWGPWWWILVAAALVALAVAVALHFQSRKESEMTSGRYIDRVDQLLDEIKAFREDAVGARKIAAEMETELELLDLNKPYIFEFKDDELGDRKIIFTKERIEKNDGRRCVVLVSPFVVSDRRIHFYGDKRPLAHHVRECLKSGIPLAA